MFNLICLIFTKKTPNGIKTNLWFYRGLHTGLFLGNENSQARNQDIFLFWIKKIIYNVIISELGVLEVGFSFVCLQTELG